MTGLGKLQQSVSHSVRAQNKDFKRFCTLIIDTYDPKSIERKGGKKREKPLGRESEDRSQCETCNLLLLITRKGKCVKRKNR